MVRKDFMHRDDWFVIYQYKAKEIGWIGEGYATHVPEHIRLPMLYIYIQAKDKMYEISKDDCLAHRQWYNRRWHIDRSFCTEIPMTEAWREQVVEWNKRGRVRYDIDNNTDTQSS